MRIETENKSVFDLHLLRTGLILLQLLFFSLLRTVIARIPWIGAWIAVTGSMMKITQVISENLTEFEPLRWIAILILILRNLYWFFVYLALDWWICDSSVSNLWRIGVVLCLLRWFKGWKSLLEFLLGRRVGAWKWMVSVFWWVGNESLALWCWCVVFIADMCTCEPVASCHVFLDWFGLEPGLLALKDWSAIPKHQRTNLQLTNKL